MIDNDRFSRQIAIPEIGEKGQERLARSTALIVGLGALGTVEAELLCRAGVGTLILIDHDVVEESNLQRQSLYVAEDVGKPKVLAAKNRLEKIWPALSIKAISGYLSLKNIGVLDDADVVLDGTDNMETRFLLNEYCKKNGIPVVFASGVLDRGSVLVVNEGPCYACVFEGRESEEDCGSAGVLNGATHLSGTVAATEALKVLLNLPSQQGLFSFSLFSSRYDLFTVKPRDDCAVCAGEYAYLSSKKAFSIRFCHRSGCFRADPLAAAADLEKVVALGARQLPDGSFELELGGHKVVVDPFGGVFFPGLKDADTARELAEQLK